MARIDVPIIVDQAAFKVMFDKYIFMEERIKLKIKPAPKWIPKKLWLRLAAKFLYIEEQRMI